MNSCERSGSYSSGNLITSDSWTRSASAHGLPACTARTRVTVASGVERTPRRAYGPRGELDVDPSVEQPGRHQRQWHPPDRHPDAGVVVLHEAL